MEKEKTVFGCLCVNLHKKMGIKGKTWLFLDRIPLNIL